MSSDRLSALDTSFLRVESPTAHMHVGWAATFAAPDEGPRPDFDAIRDHIAGRMCRAPRYRQRLAHLPLGVGNPVWVDDDRFRVDRHVRSTRVSDFGELVDQVMSTPLLQDRPLWELWIADQLDTGEIGIVGKAHHCMVDGLAAVEIATLLLDATPVPAPPEPDGWTPRKAPGEVELVVDAVREGVADLFSLALAPARAVRSPLDSLTKLRNEGARAARALGHLLEPATETSLNRPITSARHLARASRPLEDLKEIRHRHGATVNDVVLTVCAGALRALHTERGEQPPELKTMVPVNVSTSGPERGLGNSISFVFIDLPCSEPDRLRRLRTVKMRMGQRKLDGEPEGGAAILRVLEHTPPPVQLAMSRLAATSRAFNLTISNIPGPSDRLYMLGCPLETAYPVVPIADRHDLSIGMTSIGPTALFGVYADRASVPDADRLGQLIGEEIDELLERRTAPALSTV